jgi:DNA-binding CsgD family transcriptional regulator
VLFTIGTLLASLWIAIFVHALLAFPGGRLESRTARVVVAAYYFQAAGLQLGWLVFTNTTIVSQLVRRRRKNDRLEILSTRDREVLELIGEGLSNQAIAERLFVSQSAVEKHVSSIFDKLQLPARRTPTGACSPCWLCYVTDHLDFQFVLR